jgi:hypothetical protein
MKNNIWFESKTTRARIHTTRAAFLRNTAEHGYQEGDEIAIYARNDQIRPSHRGIIEDVYCEHVAY